MNNENFGEGIEYPEDMKTGEVLLNISNLPDNLKDGEIQKEKTKELAMSIKIGIEKINK